MLSFLSPYAVKLGVVLVIIVLGVLAYSRYKVVLSERNSAEAQLAEALATAKDWQSKAESLSQATSKLQEANELYKKAQDVIQAKSITVLTASSQKVKEIAQSFDSHKDCADALSSYSDWLHNRAASKAVRAN